MDTSLPSSIKKTVFPVFPRMMSIVAKQRVMMTGLVQELVAEREKNGPFTDLQDFITRMNTSQAHNKKFLESMILGGAFDCFGRPRSQLMAVYGIMVDQAESDKKFQANGQLSLFDSVLKVDEKANLVTYPNITEYATQQKLKMEKEVLGIYVSGHPLDKYKEKLKQFSVDSSKFEGTTIEGDDSDDTTIIYDQLTDGQSCTCGGIISSVKKLHSRKTNKDMAIISIEDFNGSFECMLFPASYQQYRDNLVVDKLVTVLGHISIRDGERPIVVVDKMEFWKESDNEPQPQIIEETQISKLYLKFDLTDEELKNEVFKVLEFYPGESSVVAKCSKTNKAFSLPYSVKLSVALQNELIGLLDEESVKVA